MCQRAAVLGGWSAVPNSWSSGRTRRLRSAAGFPSLLRLGSAAQMVPSSPPGTAGTALRSALTAPEDSESAHEIWPWVDGPHWCACGLPGACRSLRLGKGTRRGRRLAHSVVYVPDCIDSMPHRINSEPQAVAIRWWRRAHCSASAHSDAYGIADEGPWHCSIAVASCMF